MSVKGQEPISATTGSVEELRDAGRAGFEWLFERRGGRGQTATHAASNEDRWCDPSNRRSRAERSLAGLDGSPERPSRVHSARRAAGPPRTRVASRCPEWPQAVSGMLTLAATFCQPFRFSPRLLLCPSGEQLEALHVLKSNVKGWRAIATNDGSKLRAHGGSCQARRFD